VNKEAFQTQDPLRAGKGSTMREELGCLSNKMARTTIAKKKDGRAHHHLDFFSDFMEILR